MPSRRVWKQCNRAHHGSSFYHAHWERLDRRAGRCAPASMRGEWRQRPYAKECNACAVLYPCIGHERRFPGPRPDNEVLSVRKRVNLFAPPPATEPDPDARSRSPDREPPKGCQFQFLLNNRWACCFGVYREWPKPAAPTHQDWALAKPHI